jgi:hypothetical protein
MAQILALGAVQAGCSDSLVERDFPAFEEA